MSDLKSQSSWFVYVLECADSTLYTGIAKDVEKRLIEHNSSPKGARYTRARRPVALLTSWEVDSRSAALKDELKFKALSRGAKLKFVEESL